MRNHTAQLELATDVNNDPRWELVERIITSGTFVRSPRLCSFLTHICELSLQGRNDEINELNIGAALFERAPNYDPSIDGIVRSHASRLRQRLDQYFAEEGLHETIRLSIPKGGYSPVFEVRPNTLVQQNALPETISAETIPLSATPTNSEEDKYRRLFWLMGAALVVAGMLIFGLLFRLYFNRSAPFKPTKNPLWASLFKPDYPTLIVASDTGLTSLQTLTGANVSLAEYLSGEYRAHPGPPVGAKETDIAKVLASRRYTSIVDLDIVTKLFQMPGIPVNRIQLRYARDMHPNDLKGRSVILLGAQEGTPWVELFEDKMNFVFQHDHQRHRFVVLNRSPRANEQSRYEADLGDSLHRVYGLIALRPNLEGSGNVLILEGTSMAGTESAADFVFDESHLLPFLDKIKQKNGSVPYFELLLQSNSMNGSASRSDILAYRTSTQ